MNKVLIITYYWPPSGGSGVQRWMYFAKHLKQLGWEPIIITVNERKASYTTFDKSLNQEVENIRVIRTLTQEPLRWYSLLSSGSKQKGIPQGEVHRRSFFEKTAAYIRGNYFIPDARKGWTPFARKAAKSILTQEKIDCVITTGPPHSTHLVGFELKQRFNIKWWADFRDPWTGLFYNKELYRTAKSQAKDEQLETQVLQTADGIITTIGGELHENLKAKAPNQKFVAIKNGYDSELINATKRALAIPFHVVYTGLLSHNQEYNAVIDVLASLQKETSIRFSLAGNISSEIVEEIKHKLSHTEVLNYGYLTHHEAIALAKSADLLLNFIFIGTQTQMISGKLLEYIATEVPILSLGDPNSEAGKFVAQGSCAVMLKSKQKDEIKVFIEQAIRGKGKLKNKFPNLSRWTRKALTQQLIDEVLKG